MLIEALEWCPPQESETGLPLVFIPGGTGHARTHEVHGRSGAMGKIGRRKRRVLSVSRRGTGRSDAPATGYAPADFARDVRAAIRAAGYERFVLFGHSMGVPIGLELALRDPQGLAGLVLGDAPPRYIDFKAEGTFEKLLAERFEYVSWDDAFEAMTFRTADRAADRLRFEGIRATMFAEGPDGTVRYLIDRRALERTVEESAAAKTNYAPMLPGMSAPVLLLVASSGPSPLSPEALGEYERGVQALTVRRLPTDHDLGQRTNTAPLYAAMGELFDQLEG